jgi:hypothetical protein
MRSCSTSFLLCSLRQENREQQGPRTWQMSFVASLLEYGVVVAAAAHETG